MNGIEISASYVTLDLAGFENACPGSCTGSGASLDGGATGAGLGIQALSSARFVTIRNGIARNMKLDGVGVEGDGTVEGIVARHNARYGISSVESIHVIHSSSIENGINGFDVDEGSIIEGCTAKRSFQLGVEIDGDGALVRGTVSRNNGARGFKIVAGSKFGKDNVSTGNGAPDDCGGGICTERRRYYLTQDEFNGSDADDPSTCAPGFHFASLWEILEPSSLSYDTQLGTSFQSGGDSGSGPPASLSPGWIRTGFFADAVGLAGNGNCYAWTSSSGSDAGTAVRLSSDWPIDAVSISTPWIGEASVCSDTHGVCCIEADL